MKNKTMVRMFAIVLAILMMLIMATPMIAHAAENDGHGNEWVYDENLVVSEETEAYIASLNETFAGYKNKPQLLIMVINRLPYNIDDYKLDMFNEYGVGTKEENQGMLFVFAIEDREYALEIGDGFEKGSIIRKDLETDFITEDMKNSLRNEDYDTVVRQVAEYLGSLMADVENGVYAEKEEAAAIKRAEEEAARAAAQEKAKEVGVIALIVMGAGVAIAGIVAAVKAIITSVKRKKAIEEAIVKYDKHIRMLGLNYDDVVMSLRIYASDVHPDDVDNKILDKLFGKFFNIQMDQLLEMGQMDRMSKYKERAKHYNDYAAFRDCRIIDLNYIVSEIDEEEEAKLAMIRKNKELIANFLKINEHRIENKAIVDDLRYEFKKLEYSNCEVTYTEMEKFFVKTMRKLNFDLEFERFCAEHRDEIGSRDFSKTQFYDEICRTNNYGQYKYSRNYNNMWMHYYLMMHLKNRRIERERKAEQERQEAERRRRAAAQRAAQQQRSMNSSFGTRTGGGFSSGGGFKGGW